MSKIRTITPGEIPIPQLHQYLIGSVAPRPICFASTVDSNGLPNLAPFSFFNVFSANPPILIFAPNNSGKTGQPKHTLLNVKEVPEVVINMVNYEMVEKMNVAAAPWDRGVSEFEKAGFTPLNSDLIKPFRVAESPVQIECKVLEVKEMGQGGGAGNIVICQVLRMHISEDILNEEGKIDQHKIDLVGRLGGSWYSNSRNEALFQLAQPMVKTIGFDALPERAKKSNVLSANQLGQLSALTEWPSEDIMNEANSIVVIDGADVVAAGLIEAGKLALALAVLLKD
jgi:flavin reductase (DIM6/NTAB) family NADH-FMN oxidoreductase RutF